jgi:hypothetical protein
MAISMAVQQEVFEVSVQQDINYGAQEGEPNLWYLIMGQEMGVLAAAILKFQSGAGMDSGPIIRQEALHIASAAAQFVEALDKRAAIAAEQFGNPAPLDKDMAE